MVIKRIDFDLSRLKQGSDSPRERQILSAVTYHGEMIDAATIRLVKNIIDKADLIGM
jgi:citrate lyase subunit beta / citryl-CoA lyase